MLAKRKPTEHELFRIHSHVRNIQFHSGTVADAITEKAQKTRIPAQ